LNWVMRLCPKCRHQFMEANAGFAGPPVRCSECGTTFPPNREVTCTTCNLNFWAEEGDSIICPSCGRDLMARTGRTNVDPEELKEMVEYALSLVQQVDLDYAVGDEASAERIDAVDLLTGTRSYLAVLLHLEGRVRIWRLYLKKTLRGGTKFDNWTVEVFSGSHRPLAIRIGRKGSPTYSRPPSTDELEAAMQALDSLMGMS
jgi:predicted Zn finger-like uncharacterized protein